MRTKLNILFLASFLCFALKPDTDLELKPVYYEVVYGSNLLEVIQLKPNIFQHVSFIQIPDYGPFPYNGMVYINDGEALIFDTAIDDSASLELINWIKSQNVKPIGVVITHFHVDCLGGINAFHANEIPSYANHKTVDELERTGNDSIEISYAYDRSLNLNVGGEETVTEYLGPGHTADNVVSYIPAEKTLFGGCLIKEMDAGKGNLSDADTLQWAATVKEVKKRFKEAKLIIPGHGKAGGKELLDYTIELFKNSPIED